ncbi:unnamed protein product [Penicillium olsonii]|uniref:ABC transporter domain-containing protein n=1 Tax=Penicillium olsonii TaxID=99116 RepID=A0A9W4I3R7_PENOL|nr:unnamed protein product [Penicillium olsonii]
MLLQSILRPRSLRPAAFRLVRFNTSVPLIRIKDASFYKQHPDVNGASNPPMFSQLNFTLPPAQSPDIHHWAIIGDTNRADLLEIFRGQHISDPPEARSYPYLLTDEISAKAPQHRSVSNAIQFVGFNGQDSGSVAGTRGAYLSARYESLREETDWTLRQYLRGQTSLNPVEGEENGIVEDEDFLNQVVTQLNLEALLDMPMQNLSNGQMRRARIAKALSKKPQLLIIDEPFIGLDPATVKSISALLHRFAQRGSLRLILAFRPQDQVPDWITHMMILGNGHNVLLQGPANDVRQSLASWAPLLHPRKLKASPVTSPMIEKGWESIHAGILDRVLLRDLLGLKASPKTQLRMRAMDGEPLIEMAGVRVQYGDKVVLGDWTSEVNGQQKEGLHWRVRRGQHWAILGANGSGKTTLLSMITSDHPQTYAQPIKLFGRPRLPEPGVPGISIFELQSRIGHSSPEIHSLFPRNLTIRGALESAFADTFLAKPKLNVQIDNTINSFLLFWRPELDSNYDPSSKPNVSTTHFPVPHRTYAMDSILPIDSHVNYADKITFGRLSIAQQRIVLFLRALIAKPDIVILDEALSGLSRSERDLCLAFLQVGESAVSSKSPRIGDDKHAAFKGLTNDQALIVISHVPDEIPDSVRFFMRLPSDPGPGAEALDFRLASLASVDATLRSRAGWEMAWLPPSEFEKKAGRARRRTKRMGSQKPTVDHEIQDPLEFGWWTI